MADGMSFDQFANQLRRIKADFRAAHGRDMGTIQELDEYLDRRLAKPKRSGARSLRGLTFG